MQGNYFLYEHVHFKTFDNIRQVVSKNWNIVYEIGTIKQLSDSGVTAEEKKEIIDNHVKAHGFQRGNLLDAAVHIY